VALVSTWLEDVDDMEDVDNKGTGDVDFERESEEGQSLTRFGVLGLM